MAGFTVTIGAMRPASPLRRCFYCHVAIGGDHLPTCVLIQRRAKIRFTIEYEVAVPSSWDGQQIESHRNDSSWCINNVIPELETLMEDGHKCLCSADAQFTYIADVGEPFLDE